MDAATPCPLMGTTFLWTKSTFWTRGCLPTPSLDPETSENTRNTSGLILRGYLMPVFSFPQCSKAVVSDPEAKPESTKRILQAEII